MKAKRTINLIFAIALLLGACQASSPSATVTLTATPIMPTPERLWPESCTDKSDRLLWTYISCPVKVHTLGTYLGEVIYNQEETIEVTFEKSSFDKYPWSVVLWNDYATYYVEEKYQAKVLQHTENALKTIGIQGKIFEATLISGNLPNQVERPLEKWELVFDVNIKDAPKGTALEAWSVAVKNDNQTAYVTVYSLNGEVEIPLRYDEVKVLLSGAYDPTEAVKSVVFDDPSTSAGTDTYEEKVLRYAAQIADEGDLIGRFNWTSINGQETVTDILARTLLFKAWTSGMPVHQAVWYGFMAEKTLVTTSVTIRSSPTRGTFFLGIGSLSGGGTTSSFRQTMASAPAIYGDLYILNK